MHIEVRVHIEDRLKVPEIKIESELDFFGEVHGAFRGYVK